MAQYYSDFRNDAVGAGLPSGWTNRWATLTASKTSGNPLPDSGVSFLARPVGSFAREAASWDGVPSAQNVVVRVDATLSLAGSTLSGGDDTKNGIVSPVLCGSGTQSTRSGYSAFIRASGATNLVRHNAGSETVIATTSARSPITDLRVVIELSVSAGGVVSLFFWDQSLEKPATPLLSVNDSANLLPAGWVGWFDVSNSAYEGVSLHSISAGTNGDPAPTEPVAASRRRSPLLLTPW